MLQMPQGLTQLHHYARCQTLGVDALQRENNRWLCTTGTKRAAILAMPNGRAKSLKRPAHPAVLGLMYVFRGLPRKSGRSQDLPDR